MTKLCDVAECLRGASARGMCSLHYQRWRTKGSPHALKKVYNEGRKKHPLYAVYASMLDRCTNGNSAAYANYGGRGIRVCDRWRGLHGFTNFVNDMGERPESASIDRINNDGSYEPSNCRWASSSEQAHNKRKSIKNKSGFVGVFFHKATGKWSAQVKRGGKTTYLGVFLQIEDARKAREDAELKLWPPDHQRGEIE